jgi:dimethylhistidine N-methyltransferase
MDFPREKLDGRLHIVGDSIKEDLSNLAQDVRTGLTNSPKFLPCRYIYDRAGSILFEKICDLAEYYPTRAEREILCDRAEEIAGTLPGGCALVELGSGSSVKTRILLEAILRKRNNLTYVPVDVSRTMLQNTAVGLLEDFPRMRITAVVGDYETGIRFARDNLAGPKCFLFLGSSIGNFDRPDAVAFLRMLADNMNPDDSLLIGMDLAKDADVLERAYDDAQGVTAAFNKNILARINRELGGDFDLDTFRHKAVFNEELGRVELHLCSTVDQNVHIDRLDLHVPFAAGETIHTENSYKYSEQEIDRMAREAGLRTRKRWFDREHRFSLNLFARAQ